MGRGRRSGLRHRSGLLGQGNTVGHHVSLPAGDESGVNLRVLRFENLEDGDEAATIWKIRHRRATRTPPTRIRFRVPSMAAGSSIDPRVGVCVRKLYISREIGCRKATAG